MTNLQHIRMMLHIREMIPELLNYTENRGNPLTKWRTATKRCVKVLPKKISFPTRNSIRVGKVRMRDLMVPTVITA